MINPLKELVKKQMREQQEKESRVSPILQQLDSMKDIEVEQPWKTEQRRVQEKKSSKPSKFQMIKRGFKAEIKPNRFSRNVGRYTEKQKRELLRRFASKKGGYRKPVSLKTRRLFLQMSQARMARRMEQPISPSNQQIFDELTRIQNKGRFDNAEHARRTLEKRRFMQQASLLQAHKNMTPQRLNFTSVNDSILAQRPDSINIMQKRPDSIDVLKPRRNILQVDDDNNIFKTKLRLKF